jgi:hypothetical protein
MVKKMDKLKEASDDLEGIFGNFPAKKMSKSFAKESSYLLEDKDTLESAPIDLNKEYGLLSYYNGYNNRNKISNLFNFLNSSLESEQWTFLNLDEVQLSVNQHFKYLAIKKRYMELTAESQGILYYSNGGFHIKEHKFETLDEVKRALANKMFL